MKGSPPGQRKKETGQEGAARKGRRLPSNAKIRGDSSTREKRVAGYLTREKGQAKKRRVPASSGREGGKRFGIMIGGGGDEKREGKKRHAKNCFSWKEKGGGKEGKWRTLEKRERDSRNHFGGKKKGRNRPLPRGGTKGEKRQKTPILM